MKIFNKELLAFTLAEVLIVVGILGIVAEMTMPVLQKNVQSMQYIAGAKTAYSLLTQAAKLAINDQSTPDIWGMTAAGDGTSAVTGLGKITPYLKINPTCNNSVTCKAFAPAGNKYLHATTVDDYNNRADLAKMQMANGMSVAFSVTNPTCSATYGTTIDLQAVCAEIIVDVNGVKNPNTYGKDIFSFWLTKYGLSLKGGPSASTYTFASDCSAGSGTTCSSWVVINGNEDYTKPCASTLSWSGTITCN